MTTTHASLASCLPEVQRLLKARLSSPTDMWEPDHKCWATSLEVATAYDMPIKNYQMWNTLVSNIPSQITQAKERGFDYALQGDFIVINLTHTCGELELENCVACTSFPRFHYFVLQPCESHAQDTSWI